MKRKLVFSSTLILIVSGVIVLLLASNSNYVIAEGPLPPTPAPTSTDGPPAPVKPSGGPLLDKPLDEQQAIEIAYQIDKENSVWEESWTPDDVKTDSKRFIVQSYPDRNYDGVEYGPESEHGPVWVITIKGALTWHGFNSDDKVHNGITYVIAQNTGDLLREAIGPYQ